MAILSRQAQDMDRKILSMQSRLAEVIAEGEKNNESAIQTELAASRIARKAKIAEKQLKQKPRTSNARIAALKAQLINFSTYAPFDYEAEKDRVLKMFEE